MSKHIPHQATSHCIWMDAGVVGYKLCDRDLQCDQCPFDEIMRRPALVSDEAEDQTDPRPARRQHSPDFRGEAERILNSLFSSIDLSLLPDDRQYHRGHIWMKRVDDSTVVLGIDHVAGSILGSLASIVLPERGSKLVQKTPWCWLIHRDGALSLYSPVHGSVIEPNVALLEHPEYAIIDPYRRGWIVRAQFESKAPGNGFLDRREYWPYVQNELREMRTRFAQHLRKAPSVGQTMMDGGPAVETLCAMTGSAVYLSIVSSIFTP
jgi:glycine cleavage system H protein